MANVAATQTKSIGGGDGPAPDRLPLRLIQIRVVSADSGWFLTMKQGFKTTSGLG